MDNNSTVIIHLDRPRQLRFGHKAIKQWCAHTGKPVQAINTDNMGPEELEVLAYFLLKQDADSSGEDLRLEQMEDILDLAPLGTVYQKIGEAVIAAFPEQEQQAVKNAKRAAAGTGRNA